jgi:hypothetical protein
LKKFSAYWNHLMKKMVRVASYRQCCHRISSYAGTSRLALADRGMQVLSAGLASRAKASLRPAKLRIVLRKAAKMLHLEFLQMSRQIFADARRTVLAVPVADTA